MAWVVKTKNQVNSKGASALRLDVSKDSVRVPANQGVANEAKDANVRRINARRNLVL